MEAEAINGRTNACQSSQTPICLVGLRPFLGAKYLVVGGNYLVLLASGIGKSTLSFLLVPYLLNSNSSAILKYLLKYLF